MLEVLILSLWIGNLGIEMVLVGTWLQIQSVTSEQQEQEEEEILTRYDPETQIFRPTDSLPSTPTPMSQNQRPVEWEYKIVRAHRNVFSNPVIFQKLCQEEAESGWMLLEKIDDHRVRFKRPLSRRHASKRKIPRFDPYRCQYGPSSHGLRNPLIVLVFLTATILPAYFSYMLVSHVLANSKSFSPLNVPLTPDLEQSENP